LPDTLRQEPVVALAETTAYSVDVRSGGNVLERREVAWYRVNRRDPPLLGRLTFYENEILQEPSALRVEAYYPDRGPWVATGGSMRAERPRPEGLHVEDGGVLRTADVPHYGQGTVLRIETVERYFRPEFLSHEGMRGDYPCLRRVLSFRAPAGHGFRAALTNREGLAVRADTLDEGPWREFRYAAEGLPKILPGRYPRYPEEWYAALRFSVPPKGNRSWTWAQLGDHYLEMMQDGPTAPASLRAAAAGLGPASPGNADSLAARAFRAVKARVRYLADSRGIHGWIPRTPESVWDNGYGDCKEMANLLRALLAERGVEGGIALVRSLPGPQILEAFPALGPFDHAVYWRARPDGSVAYLDPTMPEASGAGSYLHLLGRKTLLIRPGASRPDTVRPAPGYGDRVATACALTRSAAGAWELRGEIRLKGAAAGDMWLELYAEPDRERARAFVDGVLAGRFGIQAREFSWDLPAADSVVLRFTATAEAMVLEGKGLLLDRPRLFEDGLGQEDQEGERHILPFAQTDAWTLPPGYARLSARPLDGAAARGRWTRTGDTVRRDFALDARVWPAADSSGRRAFRETQARFAAAAAWK
jgi:hypothetical protein